MKNVMRAWGKRGCPPPRPRATSLTPLHVARSHTLTHPLLPQAKRAAEALPSPPDSRARAKRARKSMGRRVSFAPDAVLETRHLYARVSALVVCVGAVWGEYGGFGRGGQTLARH